MWFSLSEQTAYFLWSLVLGAAAGALYDLLRAVRLFFGAGRRCTFVLDILFFALCGVLTSLFALPFNKGSVRGFIVFGEAVGFLTYRLTLGRLTGRFYSILSKGIMSVLKKICDLLKKIFDFLLKTTAVLVYNVCVLIDKLKRSASAIHQKRQNRKMLSQEKQKRTRTRKRRNGYEKRYKKERK